MLSASLERINILSGLYPDDVAVRTQAHPRRKLYSYTGKMMCPLDEDLLGFLLHFNHVSLPGIRFHGIGDQEEVPDLYRFTGDCWEKNSALCPYFLVFASSPSGQLIGSLTNYKNAGKKYPVACLPNIQDDRFVIIGSSFDAFLQNLAEYSTELLSSGSRMADESLLTKPTYWQPRDEVLNDRIRNDHYKFLTADNWKMEFGFT